MNISEIKELMAQFDSSSLREFSYRNASDELHFSKNTLAPAEKAVEPILEVPLTPIEAQPASVNSAPVEVEVNTEVVAEGDLVESPLVGVAYLAPAPDKPNFVSVGDTVKKGQTLLIIEAMKVMNEVPAPKDGVVTEVLVENEEVVEFGKGLVRIK
ncbi:acetyl-CoA carboxylase biotin carboxyl carrier protein [Streptococcus hyointestinalis]|uniref:Biotin carboxyl carrier protein of acetyl-CoA carboxylase n=1 Tax=Streptococcus hyointestinalis TaxID=1337 RepID=A0A380K611_9STRE|nr:acetyl-CoA carboxylase biotin carboxyl carrier protein [Streptococcus hyointestinalis]MCI6872154.1 acetyl-CoA carboxylase biotin carboxyl carrier protein [Streptococcus hyointestinalis]MDD7356196.1 acetyl-CoA carboxylase biotin carboxyl carrier protein [Streptococcus hyointestinalis]MDY4554242.1 acetyl-CoA carboxylase biotin carboxyl carrier protein [Streptococcus hyointestinalis]SUN60093.1 acetyl-CoA carboxylase biotin carboxyl carrier protein subunit [Streptococcus hyointestinalis]